MRLLPTTWILVVLTALLVAPNASRQIQVTKCRKLGLRIPNIHGQCHNAHGAKDGCCHRCTTCPPGEGTLLSETACFVTCLPCNYGSCNELTGSRICKPCSECERDHRTTITPCTRYKDARCSSCIDGYTEHSITKSCVENFVEKKSTPRPTDEKTVGTDDGMHQVGAGDGIRQTGAGDRMPQVGAGVGMPQVGAGVGMPQVGAGVGMPPWGYIVCTFGAFIAIIVIATVVYQCYKGWRVCGAARVDSKSPSDPRKDATISIDRDSNCPLLRHPGENGHDMEATRTDTGSSAEDPETRFSAADEYVQPRPGFTNNINRHECEPLQRAEPSNQILHQNVQHGNNDSHVYPPSENDRGQTAETGSSRPPHQETDQDDTHAGNNLATQDTDPSREHQPHITNENIHTRSGHCHECGQPLVPSTPSEETTRDQGFICLPARETTQNVDPVLHCPACAARRQPQFRHQERDDTIGGGRTVETSPTLISDVVTEALLEHSRNAIISDVPLDVRTRLCNVLDGNYGSMVNPHVQFAVEMGLDEVDARCAKDTNDIILKLQTMRVAVYNVITVLYNINRQDARNILLEWCVESLNNNQGRS